MHKLARLLPLIVLAMLVTAGCGSSSGDKLDPKHAEKQISQGIERQLHLAVKVHCPKNRELKKGDTFTCTADSRDTKGLKIDATQADDKGRIRWEAKIATTGEYEENIVEQIAKQRKINVLLDCPDAIPLKAGYDFTCKATDPKNGESRDVHLTLKDDLGNVTFSS